MAITVVKVGGWAFGEILTSANMTSVDSNVTNAVDKRSGALEVTSQSYTYVLPSIAHAVDGKWDAEANGRYQQTSLTAPINAYYPLYLPNGSVITAARAYLIGAAGHSALPAQMPTIRVESVVISTGTTGNLIGTGTDASASVGAYETLHYMETTGTSAAIDRTTKAYHVAVTGESGANSTLNLIIWGVRVAFTVDRLFIG